MNTEAAIRQPLAGTGTATGARAFCTELAATLAELMTTLDEEARLIRAARLRDAAALAPRKAMLAEDYRRSLERLKANAAEYGREAPAEIEDLKARHAEFERILQTNLAVLATARTVSETLVRSVAEAMGARKGPGQTVYGADARRPGQAQRTGAIAVDVAL